MEALYASEEMDRKAQTLFGGFWGKLKGLFKERRIKDVDSWDGAASNYATTADYCNACLINLNEGAEEDWTQANCKLPIRGPGDSKDTFVRQAVHAAAQRIGQVDAPAEAIASAKSELLKAYSEMDEEPPEVLTRAISGQQVFDALWQRMFDLDMQMEGSNHFLVDIYFDEGGFYALYVDRGKLYRYDLEIQENDIALGERVEVMEVHQPVQSRTVIRQQPDGKYRWFSVSGTAVLNRSGEIDSRDLFDSFIEYAERTGQYPIRMFYHQGGISENWEMDESTLAYKTGQADFLARDGYCYITSGLYDDTPLAKVEIEALQNNPDFWGESIRFWPTKAELIEVANGIKLPVYLEGFNVELSTLPERDAAHLMTRTEVHMSLNGKARDAWFKLWTDAGMTEEDALKWLAENPQARNRAIEEAGMITREEGESETPVTEEIAQEEVTETVVEVDVNEELIGALGIAEISDRLTQVETQLAERSKADGDLIKAIERLNSRLDKIEGVESARQQQVNEDKPAKFNGQTRIVYRPRFNGVDPNENGTPYAERAQANLPKGAY